MIIDYHIIMVRSTCQCQCWANVGLEGTHQRGTRFSFASISYFKLSVSQGRGCRIHVKSCFSPRLWLGRYVRLACRNLCATSVICACLV